MRSRLSWGVRAPAARAKAPPPPPPRERAPQPPPRKPLDVRPDASAEEQPAQAGEQRAQTPVVPGAPEGFLLVAPLRPRMGRKHDVQSDTSAGPGSAPIIPGAMYRDVYAGHGFAVMIAASIGKNGDVMGVLRTANDQVFNITHGPRGESNNMRGWELVDPRGWEYVCPTDTTSGGWRQMAPATSATPG